MTIVFPKPLTAIVMAAALALSFTSIPANAQTPANCTAMLDRASGLQYVATQQSLADLSISIAKDQGKNLVFTSARLLQGPCAEGVHAFLMNMIAFNDGAVFSANAKGQFPATPKATGLTTFWGRPMTGGHPLIQHAEFITGSKIGGADAQPSLNLGLWKTSEGYLVAAFIRRETGFSTPIELLRSKQQIKSVTFFPSPDTNTGGLGLVVNTENGIALLNLDWDHSSLSKAMAAESTAN